MLKPRLPIWRFLAGILLSSALIGSALLAQSAPASAQSEEATAGFAEGEVLQSGLGPTEIAPDLAILVPGLDEEQIARLVPRLDSLDGVARATVESRDDATTVFLLAVVEGGGNSRPVEAVARDAEAEIQRLVPEAETLVGGSHLVDGALRDRYSASALWVAALSLLIGLVVGASFGWKRALVTGGALFVAVLSAGSLGAQISHPFDGTVTTTAVPGALAGLVSGLAISLRLLLWFRRPAGTDGADMMRRSVADLLPELALVFSGLAVTAFIVEFLNPGRSPLTVVAVGGAVAILVVMAVLAPALTMLGPSAAVDTRRLPVSFPDGRDFPLLVVVSIAMVLVAISLFAFGSPSPLLIGHEGLDEDSEPAIVAERLIASGGDPTNALVAVRPESVELADFEGWASVVVERPDVSFVDTRSGRLTATGPAVVDETTLLVPPGRDEIAVIVLAASPRSAEGQEVASRLSAIPLAGGPADFEGEASETARIVGSRTTLITAAIVLAIVAAVALYIMTQNKATAAVALLLRLLSGAATLGILRLMVGDVTAAESLTVLALLAMGLGLFELEFLRVLNERDLDVQPGTWAGSGRRASALGRVGHRSTDPADHDHDGGRSEFTAPNPGQNAGFALLALGLAGLGVSLSAPLGGGPGMGQFGLGLLVAAVTEVLLGLIVLRPALLGQRAAFHTAVRPVRVALHSGNDRQDQSTLGTEDPAWRRTVSDLVQAEFRLQSEPTSAELGSVFVPDTPLYKQAATHHGNLAKASLRIVGRSPQLRTLKTVSGRSPITLAVTIDHPVRNLVDGEGTVVGVRKPERRSGVLWLSPADDGSYRIAESVELGSVALPETTVHAGGPADTDDIRVSDGDGVLHRDHDRAFHDRAFDAPQFDDPAFDAPPEQLSP